MGLLNIYYKKEVKENYNEIYKRITEDILSVLGEFFSDKPMFSEKNFNMYFYDDYILQTNNYKDVIPTLYVEIDQIENYKLNVKKKKKLFSFGKKNNEDDIIVPQLHLTLEDIKFGLFEKLAQIYDENTLLWLDKFSFNLSFNYTHDSGNNDNYYFKVIPCITYHNKNSKKGVMYFDESQNSVMIEYPQIAVENFNKKNEQTKGGLLQSVLLLKNMYMEMSPNTLDLPFDIFETIMYNVPNEFLEKDYLNVHLHEIINYLRNKSVRDFISIDEQDLAFVSKYRSGSVLYVKHVIKLFEKFVSKLD